MRTVLSVICLAWCVHAIGSDFFLKDPTAQNWVNVVNGDLVSFQGLYIDLEYLVTRGGQEDQTPGAVLIRVVRKYDPNWKKESDIRARTNLTRNKFPKKVILKNGQVSRELYEKYHQDKIENLVLRHEFHAKIPPDEHTNAPGKRDSFLFNDPYEGQTTHRAYLLYYSGISPNGSRIPFKVGISNAFKKISITVVELNPPSGVGFVPRRIELIKK